MQFLGVTHQQLILELADVLRVGLRTLITRGEKKKQAGHCEKVTIIIPECDRRLRQLQTSVESETGRIGGCTLLPVRSRSSVKHRKCDRAPSITSHIDVHVRSG